ncbi:MAG: TolB family protein, partial [Planctomycetota bacterium]
GKYVAYSEMRWEPPAAKRNTDLWVVECATQKVTRLTFDRAADRSPKWSPDGRWIYFAASRKQGGETVPPYNDQKQVWRVSSAGGPIFAVTRLEEGIQQFELSADGRTLYYTLPTGGRSTTPWATSSGTSSGRSCRRNTSTSPTVGAW